MHQKAHLIINNDPATGTGVGQGHGGHSNLPPLVERELPGNMRAWRKHGVIQPDTRGFVMGRCTILLSHDERGGWHLSIAHPTRYPTWDEIAYVRYELVPDDVPMVMWLPPKEEYINIHSFCLQMTEPRCHDCQGDAVTLFNRDGRVVCAQCLETAR